MGEPLSTPAPARPPEPRPSSGLFRRLLSVCTGRRRSDEQFQAAFEHAPVGMVLLGLDGQFLHVNRSYCDLTGYAAEELLAPGMTFQRLTHPDDLPENLRTYEDLLAGRIRASFFEKRYIRRDGSIAWVRASTTLRRDRRGRPFQLVSLVDDISARREADEHRRRQNERQRLLAEISHDLLTRAEPAEAVRAIFERIAPHFDLDVCVHYRVCDRGDRLELVFAEGLPEGSLAPSRPIGQAASTPPPSPAASGPCAPDAAFAPPDEAEPEILRRLGVRSYACSPLAVGDRLLGTLWFGSRRRERFEPDETEFLQTICRALALAKDRAAGQRALAESEKRLRLATEAASLGVFDWTAPGIDAAWENDRLYEIFGQPPEHGPISNAEFRSEFLHPADAEAFAAAVAEARRPGGLFRPTFRIRRRDGQVRWLEVAGRFELDPRTGAPVRMTGVVADITERKQIEEERARLLESERSARAEAERAVRLKDEFLATLGHELRTPLNAVLGWSHILGRGGRDAATVAQGLDVIARNARAQGRIIDDLLDMSRIISGKLRLDVRPVSLASVVAEAAASVGPAAEAKGITLEHTGEDAPVDGDAARLQQVFWNLLSNAVKFTPPGGTVRVTVRRLEHAARVSVTDTGIGISPEFLPHVFERFRQADGSPSRRHGGLGLGLGIAKQLVDLHGGTIRASSPGEDLGAEFVVELPLSRHGAAAPEADAALRSPPHAPHAPHPLASEAALRGVCVVAVDDDADARDLVQRVLEEHGALVLPAASAAEAMLLVERERPDVLVSDIGMPVVDGYELLRRVRTLGPDRGGDVPAVALTAFVRPQEREQALACGFIEHLVKPMRAAELVAAVAAATGRAADAAPEPTPPAVDHRTGAAG